MIFHTHIPDAYDFAILLTASIGCSNIASHINSRWFQDGDVNSTKIHWIVKFLIVLWGFYCIPIEKLFHSNWIWQCISVLPAIGLGLFTVQIELYVNRLMARKKTLIVKKPNISRYVYHRVIENKTKGLMHCVSRNSAKLKHTQEHYAHLDSKIKNYSVIDITLVAIFEEIIYRGFLWKISGMFENSWLFSLSCLISIFLFGISHITFGKGQFISKFFLGLICMISVLIVHSVLPAIIIHVVFNLFAYCSAKVESYGLQNGFNY